MAARAALGTAGGPVYRGAMLGGELIPSAGEATRQVVYKNGKALPPLSVDGDQ